MDIFAYNANFLFGDAIYKNGGRFGPLKIPNFNLSVVLKGSCKYESDGYVFDLVKGDAYLAISQDVLTIMYAPGSRSIWCSTPDVLINKNVLNYYNIPFPLITASSTLKDLITEGIKLGYSNSINSYEKRLRFSLGRSIFYEYIGLTNCKNDELALPLLVRKIKQFIDEHFTTECDLEKISESVGINKRYLTRLFKQHIGITPAKYLWQLRERYAIELLKDTSVLIGEVAALSGFKNQYHFSNYMKKKYNKSPSTIRQELYEESLRLDEINATYTTCFLNRPGNPGDPLI